MNKQLKGFTLIEMIVVIVAILILVSIGAWRLGTIRDEAKSVNVKDALAAVQRMEELATMEGLQVTATDALARLLELQEKLATKGHQYTQMNPTNVAAKLVFSGGVWSIP